VNAGQDVEICFGDEVQLEASGAATYLWDTQETGANILVSPTQTTTFSVTGTNTTNCNDADDVTVVVNQLPAQPIISAIGTALETGTANAYQWYLNGSPIPGADQISYPPSESGDYTVEIIDANGCSSISEPFQWITVGITELLAGLDVYPNPFSTRLTIISGTALRSLVVLDSQGRLVYSNSNAANEMELNTSTWADGIYLLQMQTEEGMIRQKAVKAE
jgi:hypothetical protein